MGCFDVDVPRSLSQDPRLTNADRRVWMVMRMDRKNRDISNVYSPTRLAARTKLSRPTIYSAMDRLAAAGWYNRNKTDAVINRDMKTGSWVNMTAELILSKDLQPRDMVMYGLLRNKDFKCEPDGSFTYRALGNFAQVCLKTVRRAIRTLRDTHWLNTKQKNQMAAIAFTLDSPADKYCREQIRLTKMRLSRDGGHGESIALALVTLVAEPTEYYINWRSGSLANPDTGELMEVDIYLPEYKLAIEFNGAQHYHPTSFASAEDVAKQQKRDATKTGLLIASEKIPIVLTAADLSVAAVVEKLRGLVPLRDLRLYGRLVNYLNNVGEAYRREAQRLGGQEG